MTFAALAVWLTTRRSLMWRRDISYGVYIYAWPIQSLLAMAGLASLGFLPYFAAVVVVVFPPVYARDGHRLIGRGPFRIRGRVEDHLGACTLHAERIS